MCPPFQFVPDFDWSIESSGVCVCVRSRTYIHWSLYLHPVRVAPPFTRSQTLPLVNHLGSDLILRNLLFVLCYQNLLANYLLSYPL